MKIDPNLIDNFMNQAVEESSGLSVEQMEQVYSVLMDRIWKTRGDWDRVQVTHEVIEAFDECIADMDECQQFQGRSQESNYAY